MASHNEPLAQTVGSLHKKASDGAENCRVLRKLGFVLIPVGLLSFLTSAIAWLFSRPPLPHWWDVTTAGGILCVGWGTVLILPKVAARWGAIYMATMSVVVPFITVFLSH